MKDPGSGQINIHCWKSGMGTNRGLAAICLAAFAAITAPTVAVAGSCTDTTRSWGLSTSSPSADTTVKNDTNGKTIEVNIYRGDTLKLQKRIGPGEKASFLAKLSSSDGEALLRVQLFPFPGSVSTECAYEVRNNKGDWIAWKLPGDATSVCPEQSRTNMEISCDKGYNIDKRRFNTDFRVTDR